jgi:hypothetical protein
MRGEQEAVWFTAPEGSGLRAPITANFTGTSSAAIPTGLVADGLGGAFAYFTFYCTSDCVIRFGDSGVTAADAAVDMIYPAGQWISHIVSTTHFKVIRYTADGTLKVYRSS